MPSSTSKDCEERMRATRRDFLKTVSAVAAGALVPSKVQATPAIKKGLVFDMVSDKLSYADRFKLVRDSGFEVVQALTESDQTNADEMQRAAAAAGIRIDSVMNVDHWQ